MTLILLLLSALPQATPAAPPAAPAEKLICKRIADTGSLVRRPKMCHTRAGWDKIATSARDNSQSLLETRIGPGSAD